MTPESMHSSAETTIKRLTKEIEEIDEFFYNRNGQPLYTPTWSNESGTTWYGLLFSGEVPILISSSSRNAHLDEFRTVE